jgi:putative transposase
MLPSELNQQEAAMGLVSKNDGWYISEALLQRMEPLLPPRKHHPLGCHNPRIPDRAAFGQL